MAVGAKQLQVIKSVIESVAVDVMQLDGYRLTQPPASPAPFTATFFHSISQQPQLEFMATNESPFFKILTGALTVGGLLIPLRTHVTPIIQPELFQIAINRHRLTA
jgi:hypothetical protein